MQESTQSVGVVSYFFFLYIVTIVIFLKQRSSKHRTENESVIEADWLTT